MTEMETQPAVQPVSESENVTHHQLCKRIKALIAKGDKAAEKSEQFYVAAGLELKALKGKCSTQTLFLNLVRHDIGVGKTRAYELLQIADGKKTVAEVRANTAKRTAGSKARLKASASGGQREPDEAEPAAIEVERDEDGDDEMVYVPPEDRWQHCLAHNARSAVALTSHWSENFGEDWRAFSVPSDLLALTQQATAAWVSLLAHLEQRAAPTAITADPVPTDKPRAAPAVEFDIGDIPEELRRTPAPADDDYQPPDFVKRLFAAPAGAT
jgi:hypothetical protein